MGVPLKLSNAGAPKKDGAAADDELDKDASSGGWPVGKDSDAPDALGVIPLVSAS